MAGLRHKARVEMYRLESRHEDLHENVFSKSRAQVNMDYKISQHVQQIFNKARQIDYIEVDPLEVLADSANPRIQNRELDELVKSTKAEENEYYSTLYDICQNDESEEEEFYSFILEDMN